MENHSLSECPKEEQTPENGSDDDGDSVEKSGCVDGTHHERPVCEAQEEIDHVLSEDFSAWRQTIGGGYLIEDDDRAVVDTKMASYETNEERKNTNHLTPSTYGEVTRSGARELFGLMDMVDKLDNNNDNNKQKIVFMDMGSGLGKMVMQAYMELPRISRAIGVELSPERHRQAVAAWEILEPRARAIRLQGCSSAYVDVDNDDGEGGPKEAKVQLIEGDFLEADLSEVTHMWVSSLCYTDEMMYQLGSKIQNEKPPKLECIATLRPFPKEFSKKGIVDRVSYQVVYKALGMIHRTEWAEMSWSKRQGEKSTINIYAKPSSK